MAEDYGGVIYARAGGEFSARRNRMHGNRSNLAGP